MVFTPSVAPHTTRATGEAFPTTCTIEFALFVVRPLVTVAIYCELFMNLWFGVYETVFCWGGWGRRRKAWKRVRDLVSMVLTPALLFKSLPGVGGTKWGWRRGDRERLLGFSTVFRMSVHFL